MDLNQLKEAVAGIVLDSSSSEDEDEPSEEEERYFYKKDGSVSSRKRSDYSRGPKRQKGMLLFSSFSAINTFS
jgi:hypothetical protein